MCVLLMMHVWLMHVLFDVHYGAAHADAVPRAVDGSECVGVCGRDDDDDADDDD